MPLERNLWPVQQPPPLQRLRLLVLASTKAPTDALSVAVGLTEASATTLTKAATATEASWNTAIVALTKTGANARRYCSEQLLYL